VRLKLVYVSFWSAVKLSFLMPSRSGIILIVASMLIWIVLDGTGIFGKLQTQRAAGHPQRSGPFSVTASFSLRAGGPVRDGRHAILNTVVRHGPRRDHGNL
jgi:hypothetical protein